MKLRPYQQEAIDSVFNYFVTHQNPNQNPCIAMPTGTGKSHVISGFIERVFKYWPNQKIICATHVKELIAQNADKLRRTWPEAPLGIYSSGLKFKDTNQPISFVGVQSAIKQAHEFGHQDILFIDECHLVGTNENSNYLKFISILRQSNPYLRIIGLSATPFRLGLGMITDGEIFSHVCFDNTQKKAFTQLIDDGYLCPIVPVSTDTKLDVSGVHKRGGEFVTSELQQAVVEESVTRRALEETAELAKDRDHWLIFATGIEHIHMVEAILDQMGVPCAVVHSKMPSKERDDAIKRFYDGKIRALVNSGILTTGFDMPHLDCIVMLRPTASVALHIQICGRGTRPDYAPGFDLETTEGRLAAIRASLKHDALILDFAGNTERNGPINDPKIPKKKGSEEPGDMPTKVCVHCGMLNYISATECAGCGKPFEFKERISEHASTAQLIIRDEPPICENVKVDYISYGRHAKPGSTPSLKVHYHCGFRRYTEFICLEHTSGIRHKARKWWRQRTSIEPPETISEAMHHVDKLKVPHTIKVWINKKYPEVINYDFVKEPQL